MNIDSRLPRYYVNYMYYIFIFYYYTAFYLQVSARFWHSSCWAGMCCKNKHLRVLIHRNLNAVTKDAHIFCISRLFRPFTPRRCLYFGRGESYFLVGVSFIGLGCRIGIELRFADRFEVLWMGWMQNFWRIGLAIRV